MSADVRAEEFQIPHLTTSPFRWWLPKNRNILNTMKQKVRTLFFFIDFVFSLSITYGQKTTSNSKTEMLINENTEILYNNTFLRKNEVLTLHESKDSNKTISNNFDIDLIDPNSFSMYINGYSDFFKIPLTKIKNIENLSLNFWIKIDSNLTNKKIIPAIILFNCGKNQISIFSENQNNKSLSSLSIYSPSTESSFKTSKYLFKLSEIYNINILFNERLTVISVNGKEIDGIKDINLNFMRITG